MTQADNQHQKRVDSLAQAFGVLKKELGKVIVGQEDVVEEVLTAVFARGHCLLEGAPGLAKTLLISTLAKCMQLEFRRVQFTPDLMPSDIVGSELLQDDPVTGKRMFQFQKGPIFTNILLADEINRTPPKTQAALLEAMQEKQITAGGKNYKLDPPFFVLATQNPVDQEGTYPLPEAQLDRFLYKIVVDYPTEDEEVQIVKKVTSDGMGTPEVVLTQEHVIAGQGIVKDIVVADAVIEYATRIARATRPKREEAPDFIKEFISWGAGPRASLCLIQAAKARAALNGRYYAAVEDVQTVALPVMRHRIIPNFTAQAEGYTSDDLVRKLLEAIPVEV
ncbi:MAG: MoxR family ATPase [Planctomycetota bacterium]|nr:MoxR family ATPase [Planctomycetota bacterium]